MVRIILIIAVILVVVGTGYYFVWPYFDVIERDDAVPLMETEEMGKEEPPFLGPYEVIGTAGHPASGTVKIFEMDGTYIVRYEDLKTINGPDLHIYLSKTPDAKDGYIDLGRIKGTQGNINYEVPEDVVDIGEYGYVLTWCEPFSVLFNYIEIR